MKKALHISLLLALSSAAPGARAAADPCDFGSGAATFAHEQVLRCYQQVPLDPAAQRNITSVIEQARSFSDLSELYEQRVGWKRRLRAIEGQSFASDFELQQALVLEHKAFRNPHVLYQPPACYSELLAAFLPLELGSALSGQGAGAQQIIFVQSGQLLADLYQQDTGIDARPLAGQRVVSINGVPVLDYLQQFSALQQSHADPSGDLNGVVQQQEYTLRLGRGYSLVPAQAADTFVFESRSGQRQTLVLPWRFFLLQSTGDPSALPPTASTAEFLELCRDPAPQPPQFEPGGERLPWLSSDAWQARERLLDRVLPSRQRRLTRSFERGGAPLPRSAAASPLPRSAGVPQLPDVPEPPGFFEVPPERRDQDIQELVPLTDGAVVLQYGQDVTALHVFDTVGWIDVARQGIAYACEHSQRLIVDVRDNRGGSDLVIRWLHHHLFPEQGQELQAGRLALRVRNDRPLLNQVLSQFASYAQAYPDNDELPRCALGLVPGCVIDLRAQQLVPLSEDDWFSSPRKLERRGQRLVSLSRQISVRDERNVEFDVASCAGRFQAEQLIFITNGSNGSGGYFLPAAFQGEGVIVSTGGLLGQPTAMGRAHGGAVFGASSWRELADLIASVTDGQLQIGPELLRLDYPVLSTVETLGAYHEDLRRLHLTDPVPADLHVHVWTDSPDTDGFVYEHVLRAVDQGAPLGGGR